MTILWRAILIMTVVILLFPGIGCGPKHGPTGVEQEGLASWYGPGFHGHRAADTSRYSQYHLTAAHRTLPFGTRVHVTNCKNGRNVVVTITDRGPFVDDRILDLSWAAARRLGMTQKGVAKVRIRVLE